MKLVLALSETVELELLRSLLEKDGISCSLRNEQFFHALPLAPFNIELWVSNDDDFPRARELCQAWLHPAPNATGVWTCTHCGQRLKSQFDSCWKCGTKRGETVKLTNEGEDDENVSRFVD